MTWLPIELIIIILQEAQYNDLLPCYKWLKNYALVCRAWSEHAQRLLFANVALNKGAEHGKTFKKALISSEAREAQHAALLKGAVRTLAMAIDHQEIYADIVELCPNLRELHLSIYHASFRPQVLHHLGLVGSRIQALRVRTYHYTTLFQVLSIVPNVEYLEVDCNSVRDNTLVLPSSPPAWPLRELRYTNLHRFTDKFVKWALSSPAVASRGTLEVLRVISPSFKPSTLSMLESTVRSSIRSLAVQHLHDDDDVSALTRLQELTVTFPQHPLPTFHSLPTGIVHVALGTMSAGECNAMIAGLATYQEQSGGPLQVLTYNRQHDASNRHDSTMDIDTLYEFCLEHGIKFRLMSPPYGFYAGERVPLERADSFPRPVPLSSRRPAQLSTELSWKTTVKGKRSLARRIAHAAGKAFGSTIPPAALAKP